MAKNYGYFGTDDAGMESCQSFEALSSSPDIRQLQCRGRTFPGDFVLEAYEMCVTAYSTSELCFAAWRILAAARSRWGDCLLVTE